MRRWRWLLIAVLVLVVPSAGGAAAAGERAGPADMAARLASAVLPGRSPLDLAVRLRGVSPATPLVAPMAPAPLAVGFEDNFWILDQRPAHLFQTKATLRLVTEHTYWFVETDLDDNAPQADIERSADVFESQTYPLIHRYFGSEPSPTVDGGNHIVFLLGNVPGVAAYFSSADAYPIAVNPSSNQHDMIYVNLNSLRPGQSVFDSTITHEFQHMTQFAHCPNQEGWVDEGASELAMRVAGYGDNPPLAFGAHPDVQLNAWTDQPGDLSRHYQAAYLFLRYVAERAGGWDALPRLFSTCARGEGLFAAFLAVQPIDPDVDSLFADWTVANLLEDGSVADGRYAYANGIVHVNVTGSAALDTPFLGGVSQYAANYVEVPPGAAGTATFSGDASVPLLGADVDANGVWWSNRGDSLDSRLTRRVDLTSVAAATLRFRAWYDLENQFDFVYLTASRDNGKTWLVLPGQHTVPDQATGNNYGVGWTGSSDGWVDESVDLAPLVGSNALVRFEYVTDQAYNAQGFALKDVQISALGVDEPGAMDGPWTAEGWLRVDGPIPQHWNLRLVRFTPGGIMVDPVPVTPDGTATFTLDETASRTVLVIAPTAPRTLLPGNYSLALSP